MRRDLLELEFKINSALLPDFALTNPKKSIEQMILDLITSNSLKGVFDPLFLDKANHRAWHATITYSANHSFSYAYLHSANMLTKDHSIAQFSHGGAVQSPYDLLSIRNRKLKQLRAYVLNLKMCSQSNSTQRIWLFRKGVLDKQHKMSLV